MSKITTVGIDLAKNAFSIHGADEHGKVVACSGTLSDITAL